MIELQVLIDFFAGKDEMPADEMRGFVAKSFGLWIIVSKIPGENYEKKKTEINNQFAHNVAVL